MGKVAPWVMIGRLNPLVAGFHSGNACCRRLGFPSATCNRAYDHNPCLRMGLYR